MKAVLEFDLTRELDRRFHDQALQAPGAFAALRELAAVIEGHEAEYVSTTVLRAHLRTLVRQHNLELE